MNDDGAIRRHALAPPSLSLTTVGWLVAACAWAVIGISWAVDGAAVISHDSVLDADGTVGPLDIVAFVAAWQLMTAAMMLPTSLPMIRLFARASRGQERPRLAMGLFLGAYFVVWTGFAVAALAGDAILHEIVERIPWLSARPSIIGGAILIGAGAFQFTGLKERCLDECRNALHFMWRYYSRGLGAAWSLGVRHALFCLGCCWALMLLMFAVGVGNLAWMVILTGVMLVEKTSTSGRRLVPIVGFVLVALGLQAVGEALLVP
jgi:predicted metal-binding membrane protein